MCIPIAVAAAVVAGAGAIAQNVQANRAAGDRRYAAAKAKEGAAKVKRASDLDLKEQRTKRYASQSRGGEGVEYGSTFASGGGMFSPRSFFRG